MKSSFLMACFCVTGVIALHPAIFGEPIGGSQNHAAKLLSKGDPAGARRELEARLKKKPNDEKAKLLLGVALVRLSEQSDKSGDRPGAIALDQQALAIDPDEPYWHSALAKLLNAQGDVEEATKECSQAAELFPLDSGLSEGCGIHGKSVRTQDGSVPRVDRRAGMTPPVALEKPEPAYSEKARSSDFQGTTVLWIVINTEGEVEKTSVEKPLGLGLDENAVRAVRTWKFKPALKDGRPVAVKVSVEVSFRLF